MKQGKEEWVVENEEFKGKGINGKYHNFKFA